MVYFVLSFLNFKLNFKSWIRIQILQKCGSNADPDPKPCNIRNKKSDLVKLICFAGGRKTDPLLSFGALNAQCHRFGHFSLPLRAKARRNRKEDMVPP